jgi:very-short-patch-repair endonuclease
VLNPEDEALVRLREFGMGEPEREFRFHSSRRWRFDFAYPEIRLAVEIEGGTWNKGRHVRGQGYANDCVKYNTAAILGWTVLRFTSELVRRGAIEEALREYLEERKK